MHLPTVTARSSVYPLPTHASQGPGQARVGRGQRSSGRALSWALGPWRGAVLGAGCAENLRNQEVFHLEKQAQRRRGWAEASPGLGGAGIGACVPSTVTAAPGPAAGSLGLSGSCCPAGHVLWICLAPLSSTTVRCRRGWEVGQRGCSQEAWSGGGVLGGRVPKGSGLVSVAALGALQQCEGSRS